MKALAYLIAIGGWVMLAAGGCMPKPCKTWNPALNPPQCQMCRTASDGSTEFYGSFLPSSECSGQPTPVVVEPEPEE